MKKYPKAAALIKTRKIMATMNLEVRLIRKWKKGLNRLINAVGFFCHIISKALIGPGTAASADFSELASSAFSLIAIHIAKILENLRGLPNLFKRFFSQISAVHFQIAAGLHLTDMGDEAEGDTSQTTPGHGIQSILLRGDLLPLFFGPLPENAIIVGSTGGLQLEGDMIPLLIKPVERFFIIESRYFLIHKFLSPSGGNQEEDVVGDCSEVDRQLEDLGDQVKVGLGDGGIDLEFKSSSLCHLDPPEGSLKGAFDLSKSIMCFWIGAVEADADSLNPGSLHGLNRLFCDQGAVRGHHHPKSLI
jgi:hypothetical protein